MKTYTITNIHSGRRNSKTGTMTELTAYYRYTLECGNSWNPDIPLQPKTARSLVSALNRSVKETQGSSYDPDYYYIEK